MRIVTSAVATAALLAFQASPSLSQTTTPAAPPGTTAPVAPAPAAPVPNAPVPEQTAPATNNSATPAPNSSAAPAPTPHKAARHAKRMTMHQRFSSANKTSDGHLTLDQANAAKWSYVSRHFDSIDKDHKGYVTEADIQAYAHAQRAAHHAAKMAAPATTAAPPAAAPGPAPAEPAPAAPATPAPAPPAQQQ